MNQIAVILSIYRKDNLFCVKEALDSLFAQTFSSTDIFIQLDGCIDNKVREYLSNLPKKDIFIFERTQNKGLACSLNDLLKIVLPKGYQYIARMDADDISMPERFEKQIIYMESHPNVDCLGTWAIEINDDGNEYFRKQMPVMHEECLDFFRVRDCMIHPTVMFRRSYFEKAGLYPEDTYFGEDTKMWAKGFKAECKFANLPEYLLKFRLDSDFFQRRRGWKHAKSIFTLRRQINEMLGFGLKEDGYALMYAIAKLMPIKILDFIYRKVR